ncbi:MAG: hypothetical protein CVU91_02305 [Firmicutes bacterium HGW-Firmicutes-16]|nr:MAG: hypothetical protein CVU91_02305 [Firmicutes bacterium HGW-Firmicutes-16]
MVITAVEIYRKFWNHRMQILSFFLCLVLIFSCSIAIPFTKAEAGPAALLVVPEATIALVQQLLIYLGVAVVTYVAVNAFCQYIQDTGTNEDIMQWWDAVDERDGFVYLPGGAPPGGGGQKLKLLASDGGMLIKFYELVKEFFPGESGLIAVSDLTSLNYTYHGITLTNVSENDLINSWFNTPYGRTDIVSFDFHTYKCNQSSGILTLDNAPVYYYATNTWTISDTSTKSRKWGLTFLDGHIFPYMMIANFTDSTKTYFATLYDGRPSIYLDLYPDMPYGRVAYVDTDIEMPMVDTPYINNPKFSPSTVIDKIIDTATRSPIEVDIDEIIKRIQDNEPVPDEDQEGKLIDIGIIIDPTSTQNPNPTPTPSADPAVDPDEQYKPAIIDMPDIGGLWDYVSDFMSNALIWMLLWFNGFSMLPLEIQYMLWALLIITIVTGLLGVFLK